MPQPRRNANTPREGREGGRWYNARPTSDEFAEWFQTVPIHAGLEHANYIGGIVVIQQQQKEKEVIGFDQSGQPQIAERTHLIYTPHPTVATRIRYFEDWKRQQEAEEREIVAALEIDPPPGATGLGLPEGFFKYVANDNAGKPAAFIGYSVRLRIYRAGTVKFVKDVAGTHGAMHTRRVLDGDVLAEYPAGSKIVPAAGRFGVDENALMKAQTGATGRALGMAGMLAIPGSSVATAEDIRESVGGHSDSEGVPGAELPQGTAAATPIEADPVKRAADLVRQLEAKDPVALEDFRSWARDRGITLADAAPADLTTAIKRLEKLVDGA